MEPNTRRIWRSTTFPPTLSLPSSPLLFLLSTLHSHLSLQVVNDVKQDNGIDINLMGLNPNLIGRTARLNESEEIKSNPEQL